MKTRLGIPRGMFYHDYHVLWEEFFNNLGIEVIISPKSNGELLNRGVHACVEEACLPVKIYHGHVDYLKDKVDHIFIPKFISIYKDEYCCPKHLGLSDMVRHSIEGLPNIIDTQINLRKSKRNMGRAIRDVGQYFTKDNRKIYRAFNNAYEQFTEYSRLIRQGKASVDIEEKQKKHKKQILLLGHSYNIYDEYINMNIASKLENRKVNIITAEMIEDSSRRLYTEQLSKRMFWTHGHNIVGAAYLLIERKKIDGIIYISSFGCGLDSVLIDLVERKAREYRLPFILLTIDELTGEAGFNTRIEAFLDMLEWRDANENNLSSHG